jgi:hypothetical protein
MHAKANASHASGAKMSLDMDRNQRLQTAVRDALRAGVNVQTSIRAGRRDYRRLKRHRLHRVLADLNVRSETDAVIEYLKADIKAAAARNLRSNQ